MLHLGQENRSKWKYNGPNGNGKLVFCDKGMDVENCVFHPGGTPYIPIRGSMSAIYF